MVKPLEEQARSKKHERRGHESVFYHAYLVYDANNNFYMASNPVPLRLVK